MKHFLVLIHHSFGCRSTTGSVQHAASSYDMIYNSHKRVISRAGQLLQVTVLDPFFPSLAAALGNINNDHMPWLQASLNHACMSRAWLLPWPLDHACMPCAVQARPLPPPTVSASADQIMVRCIYCAYSYSTSLWAEFLLYHTHTGGLIHQILPCKYLALGRRRKHASLTIEKLETNTILDLWDCCGCLLKKYYS